MSTCSAYNLRNIEQNTTWFKKPYLYVCACVCAPLLQSCSSLCHPVEYSLPNSSVHGIFQARLLEWVVTHINVLTMAYRLVSLWVIYKDCWADAFIFVLLINDERRENVIKWKFNVNSLKEIYSIRQIMDNVESLIEVFNVRKNICHSVVVGVAHSLT